MARFSQLDRHSLYPVEQWGDTLVVLPRGDAAGFNPTTVNHEMATVTELAQSPGIRHLVLDLGGANYLGSIVLGGLVQLTQTVKNRGGRVAICNASQDMQDILRIMKLDGLWEVFPDQRAALRRMARIPFRQHVWASRKFITATAAVLVLCLAYVFYPRPNYGRIYYEQVRDLWKDFEKKQPSAGEEEWGRFADLSTKRLKPIIDHINRRAKASIWKEPERYLLYAARDHWPAALRRNDPNSRKEAEIIAIYLQITEAVLDGRNPPADMFSLITKEDSGPITPLAKPATPAPPPTTPITAPPNTGTDSAARP